MKPKVRYNPEVPFDQRAMHGQILRQQEQLNRAHRAMLRLLKRRRNLGLNRLLRWDEIRMRLRGRIKAHAFLMITRGFFGNGGVQ